MFDNNEGMQVAKEMSTLQFGHLWGMFVSTPIMNYFTKHKIKGGFLVVGFFVAVAYKTALFFTNTIEKSIEKYSIKYNIPQVQNTNDHLNITIKFQYFTQDSVNDILSQYKDKVEVITMFVNKGRSSILMTDKSLQNHIDNNKVIDKVGKNKKLTGSFIRKGKMQECLKYANCKILNFYETEYDENIEYLNHNNVVFLKSEKTPLPYGVYTFIKFKDTGKIIFFFEIGGCQIENYTLKTRETLDTLLYFIHKPIKLEDILQDSKFYHYKEQINSIYAVARQYL